MTTRLSVRVGFTGHQTLSSETRSMVQVMLRQELAAIGSLVGLTSLAAGADQLFAEAVLNVGGSLIAVIPCEAIEETFDNSANLLNFQRYLNASSEEIRLPFDRPSEQAYWAAGKRIVDLSDVLMAVWDGKPAAGLGGTGDVVVYALSIGRSVTVIWPEGSSR